VFAEHHLKKRHQLRPELSNASRPIATQRNVHDSRVRLRMPQVEGGAARYYRRHVDNTAEPTCLLHTQQPAAIKILADCRGLQVSACRLGVPSYNRNGSLVICNAHSSASRRPARRMLHMYTAHGTAVMRETTDARLRLGNVWVQCVFHESEDSFWVQSTE